MDAYESIESGRQSINTYVYICNKQQKTWQLLILRLLRPHRNTQLNAHISSEKLRQTEEQIDMILPAIDEQV